VNRVVLLAVMGVMIVGLAACGRPAPQQQPAPPVLAGQRVMLLPVRAGDPPELDVELARWLTERSPTIEWLLPAELQAVMDRAPAWRVRLNAMPRNIAQPRSREPHLVDPTYGDLRRLGAIVDVHLAVLPVTVRRIESEGSIALELTAALVDIRGGRVLWMATARGEAPSESPDVAVAGVAEALARTLFPS
jgi:hypothetical protein